jgi:hypothetical protein
MAETIAILKDTPIPTLMIIGGIALLVLSVVTSISDKVKVAPERQKWAWIAGLILVVIGAALFLIEPGENPVEPGATPTTIRQATATQAIATSMPTATLGGTAVVACTTGPDYFAEYWLARINQLGCPLAANSGGLKITQQSFEHGWMFGREDTLTIYVFYSDHKFETFPDTWARGQDEYSCPDISVSQTPPTPRQGFGKIWCQSETLRRNLGLAIDAEQAINATLQIFENGVIFQVKKDIFLLDEGDQTWEQLK